MGMLVVVVDHSLCWYLDRDDYQLEGFSDDNNVDLRVALGYRTR